MLEHVRRWRREAFEADQLPTQDQRERAELLARFGLVQPSKERTTNARPRDSAGPA